MKSRIGEVASDDGKSGFSGVAKETRSIEERPRDGEERRAPRAPRKAPAPLRRDADRIAMSWRHSRA